MTKVRALRKDVLPEAPGRPGITRHLAFRGRFSGSSLARRPASKDRTLRPERQTAHYPLPRHGTSDPCPDFPTLGDLGTIGSKKV